MAFEYADWPLPVGVHAGWSTREQGASSGVYARNNMGGQGEDVAIIRRNRQQLQRTLKGQPEIQFLQQTHSTEVIVDPAQLACSSGQDGFATRDQRLACCVLTADCLPILLWSEDGAQIAAIHAGWRGLAAGIVANAIAVFDDRLHLCAGIGPAISRAHFEVGDDVRIAFQASPHSDRYFVPGQQAGKYWCDLPGLAQAQLQALGVTAVFLSDRCTYAEEQLFYSYRRDGNTGRMANLIWKA